MVDYPPLMTYTFMRKKLWTLARENPTLTVIAISERFSAANIQKKIYIFFFRISGGKSPTNGYPS